MNSQVKTDSENVAGSLAGSCAPDTVRIIAALAHPVGADAPADAYYVEALLGGGRVAYHRGPKDFAFFTEQEARRLAEVIETRGEIDPQHWTNSRGGALSKALGEAA